MHAIEACQGSKFNTWIGAVKKEKMPSNVEIKARLVQKRHSLEVARQLSQSEGE